MNWQEVIADILDILSEAKTLPLLMGGGFFAVIKSIPDMIRVAQKIWKLKIDAEHLYEVVQKIPVMADAIRKAKETGDTSALEKLFGRPDPSPPKLIA